jgi:isopenicillin N synthase-like dioxygenase
MSDRLPIIDLAPLAEGVPGMRRVAAALADAFERIGFAYIVNHGVPAGLIEDAFAASRAFHALPVDRKLAIRMNAWHRGYMPFASSKIVTSTIQKATRPNQSESFMLMHEVPPDDPRIAAGVPLAGPNQWPDDLPGFRSAVTAYDTAMQGLARRFLPIFEQALGLADATLAPLFRRPTTFLRMLHYPPQPPDSPDDLFGSQPHTDYGFITLLVQDDAGGLQVRTRDGSWMDAPPVPGSFVMNVGDITQRWTNDRFVSTPHRVRNFSGRDRYSIPYFFDPDMDALIECIAAAGQAPRHAPVEFGAYLMSRLDANYDYRKRATAGA